MPRGISLPVGDPGLYWSTYAIESEGAFGLTKLRDQNDLNIVGLLKRGVNMNQAQADLNTIQRGLAQQYSEDRLRPAVAVMPLLDEAVSDARTHL